MSSTFTDALSQDQVAALLQRVESRQTDNAGSQEDSEELDELAALMAEPPVETFGSKRSDGRIYTSPEHDGEIHPREWNSLNSATIQARSAVREGSLTSVSRTDMQYLGGKGWRPEDRDHGSDLTRGEWAKLDQEEVRDLLLERMGFTLEEYGRTRLTVHSPEQQALRARWDEALLKLVEGGASTSSIARALGWMKEGRVQDQNVARSLARARKRRKLGSTTLSPIICSEPTCNEEFTPTRESQKFCSRKCTHRASDRRRYARKRAHLEHQP